MSLIAVHGAYCGDNFGDTLLLGLLCRKIVEMGHDIAISNVCDFTLARLQSIGGVRRFNQASDYDKCSCLVYGGGGYFGEQPLRRIRWNLRFARTHLPIAYGFLMRKKSVYMLGVEAGPMSSFLSRRLTALCMKRFACLALRNRESIDFVESLGVDRTLCCETADIALSMGVVEIPEIDLSEVSANSKRVLLHPSGGPWASNCSSEIAKIVKRYLADNSEVELCLMSDRAGSRVMLDEWASYLGACHSQIFEYSGPWETCALIRASGCVITNKLHTAIVASAYGKSVISVPKHPKNVRFFDQIKRQDLCVTLNGFDAEKFERLIYMLSIGRLEPVKLTTEVVEASLKNYLMLEKCLQEMS
ncbi:polysaccharide pyruvyl transferase family protein [Cerasicoccus frondis]|uniref:polysaccharide pyruvyl transferase family protein n=1 Tax=Cerasicoccus frondis TaxID=490090 RepID=UPI002852D1D7|nr:polysaccharide pyruvyl transferase family protein [Cerasicoccus frondis]